MMGASLLRWARDLNRRVWHRERTRWKIAYGFDSVWLRRALLLSLLLTVVSVVLIWNYAWAMTAFLCSVLGLGALSGLYFVHLLFRRMQCSLLEWILLVLALSNVEGLLLSTPHLKQLGSMAAVTAILLAVLVLYGFVTGLAEAQLLGLQRTTSRVLLILANWVALPGPVLLMSGLALAMGRGGSSGKGLVSPAMAAWALPLIASGLLGTVLLVLIAILVRRRACRILNASGQGSDPAKAVTGAA